MSLPATIAAGAASAVPLRVMIVDDAVVVRGLMARWFEEAGGIKVVSTHRSGAEAVAAIERVKPDVVILDIQMPDMDGVTALPLLLKKAPDTSVIIASTLTTRNAEISLHCLSLGALDYIAKPSTNRDVTFSTDFRREVVEKVKALGTRGRSRLEGATRRAAGMPLAAAVPRTETAGIALKQIVKVRPNILLIGASTGGPSAVTALLKLTRPSLSRIPIVVIQHMPATFTAMFADHLSRTLAVDASEAVDGEPIDRGRIYIAPGGRHLRLAHDKSGVRALIEDTPPVNFCRPSVDVTFSSGARIFGRSTLGIVLTGMGSDGLAGANDIIGAGGNLFAQDEATSVVWGMPGAVAKRGLCAVVDRVPRLAEIVNIMAGVGQP